MTKPLATLRLPYPPTVNHYRRTDYKRKLRYVTKKGKAFRVAVEAAVWQQLGRPPKLNGALRVTLAVTVPDRLKRDIDNLLKAPLDAMQHAGVYADDNQIRDLRIRHMGVDSENRGRLDVVIESAEELPLFDELTGVDDVREQTEELF